jgi:hypothetical protein
MIGSAGLSAHHYITGPVFELFAFQIFFMSLWTMDIEVLKKLYEEQSSQLQQKLLKGVSWRKVAWHRKKVSKLSSVIYKKLNHIDGSNPAEHGVR